MLVCVVRLMLGVEWEEEDGDGELDSWSDEIEG
jgi:hypothetical protein